MKDGIKAAIRRRDFLTVKLLAASPTIPKAICTCKPVRDRLTSKRQRRPPRPLRRRPPGAALNTCYTAWPGGFSYTPPDQAVAPGNLRTGFSDGFPTNPRCYPPRLGALLDAANDGTFRGARRSALLAHRDPDATASEIGALITAAERGRVTPDVALRRISELAAPPTQITQALAFRPAESAEERRARLQAQQTGALDDEAYDLGLAEQSCRPTWCCYDGETFSTSTNRGVTKDRAVVNRNRARGFRCRLLDLARVRQTLGHTASPDEEVGACADPENYLTARRGERLRARPALARPAQLAPALTTQPATQPIPISPAPPPPPPGPPPPPPPPTAGVPVYDCVRTPFGFPIGDHVQGTQAELIALGVWATYPWACREIG
ncbi:MAG: hypothetical protein ACRD0K_19395 [Egibacteraceae bacterium]